MRMKRKEKKKNNRVQIYRYCFHQIMSIGLALSSCMSVFGCAHIIWLQNFKLIFKITIWPSLNKNWNFRLHYILFKITTSNKFTRKFLIFKNFPLYFRFKIGPKLFCQFFNSSIFFSFSNKSMHLNRIRVIFDIFAEILQFFKIVNKKRFYFKSAS